MANYEERYQRCASYFRSHPYLLWLLTFINSYVTLAMYGFYPLLLLWAVFSFGFKTIWALLAIPATGFALVTLFRHFYNQPRPYQTWNIAPLITKDTQGHSMPSRHVFSAVMISMVWLRFSLIMGGALLFLSFLLAICRVLAGVHYVKDVLVGYVLGVFLALPLWCLHF